MLRRSLIFALCLSLAALAPLPLSVCAALAALPSECQECQQMGVAEPAGAPHTDFDPACCQLTAAPLPEAVAGAAKTLAAFASVDVDSVRLSTSVSVAQEIPVRSDLFPAFSPPDRQPLLCVFLI